jgi:hypothetical protein
MIPFAIPRNRPAIETELGTEVQCCRCGEFFPADSEFFYSTKGRPHSWRKACCSEAPITAAKAKQSEALQPDRGATA